MESGKRRRLVSELAHVLARRLGCTVQWNVDGFNQTLLCCFDDVCNGLQQAEYPVFRLKLRHTNFSDLPGEPWKSSSPEFLI